MIKKWLFVSFASLVLLSACGIGAKSSLSENSKPQTSETSNPQSSASSLQSSKESSPQASEGSKSSSSGGSSQESNSSSSEDLQGKFIVDSKNSLTFVDGVASFETKGIRFSIYGGAASSQGWFTLNQGGYLTNSSPLASSFSSISVDYVHASDFGYLTTRASSYPISSPENGAYEIAGSTSFSFSEQTLNSYFSLHAPVGSFTIKSITLTTEASSLNPSSVDSIDFYTINDTHGAAEEVASSRYSGITRLSQFALTTERNNPESTLFLSSGDMWQGSADSNLTHGALMVNWMNIAGFESMAIGNHEFDWKPAQIAENSTLANFPFLGINIKDTAVNRPSWARPSKVVKRGAYKIGIIGAIGPVENSIAVSSLSGYTFDHNYPALISEEADRLRNEEGCALVVLSIHNGSFDTAFCHNIDAVFEGHSHLNYENTDSYGIPHLQTYGNGSSFQHAHFELENGKFVFKTYDMADFSYLSSLSEEAMTLGIYGYYGGKIASIKNEVIGTTASKLYRGDIAKLAVQAMFEYFANSKWDSALALAAVNTGCARADIPAGNITYGQIYACLPFDNDNVFCTCTGQQVKALQNDTYLYTYGTTATIDPNKTYHVIIISYVSEKEEYSYLKEEQRDDYRLRDILADDFRRNMNA